MNYNKCQQHYSEFSVVKQSATCILLIKIFVPLIKYVVCILYIPYYVWYIDRK